MKRDFDEREPELMDLPQPVTAELERDLANLVSLNRFYGGHRLIRTFLGCWLKSGETYRILDVCTGAGDGPRLMVDYARKHSITVRIDAIDAAEATIEIAKKASADYPEITYRCEDALIFDPGYSYDLVCCSLALHHFSNEDAVRLLRRARDLSQHWVLVADLERRWSTSLGIWLLTALIYRDPMTRYDGRLSARRAFSYLEMRDLAEKAGWAEFGHERFMFCRQAIWLSERDMGDIPSPVVPVPAHLPSPA
jgi:2-polyprenyl-3-methyl-5-hydroxy-6-metoxy-1,4-benzoquinol methylase